MGYFVDDDSKYEICTHPEHNPPSMIYIPSGKVYIHECPRCGNCTRLHSSNIML